MKKKKKIILICIIICIFTILAILSFIFKTNDNITEEQNLIYEDIDETSFDELFINYILDSIEYYSKEGSLYKISSENGTSTDIISDVDKQFKKLTPSEAKENRDLYASSLNNILNSKIYKSEMFYLPNSQSACTYNFESIINQLGLITNNRKNIGCYDNNGNKLYIYGTKKIENLKLTPTNIIESFAFKSDTFIEDILNEIKNYSEKGYITKSNSSNLSIEDFEQSKNTYTEKIKELLNSEDNIFELTYTDEKLYMIFYYEYFLNTIDLTSSNLNIGTNDVGLKTYIFD